MGFRFEVSWGKEKRSVNDPVNQSQNPEHPRSNPSNWLLDIFGGGPTSSGVRVDPNTASAHSAVYRAVALISSTIASLPYTVIRKTPDNREIVRDHVAYMLMKEPSDLYTGHVWRESMQQYALLWGNGYSEIIRDGRYNPIAFELHESKNVRPFIAVNKSGYKAMYYEISEPGINGVEKRRIVSSIDMIHIPCLSFDGIAGKSIVEIARESIGLGLAAEKFGGNFYKNNAAFSGVFTNPHSLNDEAYKRLSDSLAKKAEYGEKAKPLLLEDGLDYKPITMPLADAQFLESRKFQINEIARWFGVPPHKLADLSASTNNNIEQQSLEFVTDCIWQWCEKWEAELDRKLFTEKEKRTGELYSHFDLDRLMRGDAASRVNKYRTMWSIGAINQDEIRESEDMSPIPEGEGKKFYIPLNMAEVGEEPETPDATDPNDDPKDKPIPGAPGMGAGGNNT